MDRHRSSVNFGGKAFLPENYLWKINKMPEFYMIIARKIFSRILGRNVSPLPPPHLLRLWIYAAVSAQIDNRTKEMNQTKINEFIIIHVHCRSRAIFINLVYTKSGIHPLKCCSISDLNKTRLTQIWKQLQTPQNGLVMLLMSNFYQMQNNRDSTTNCNYCWFQTPLNNVVGLIHKNLYSVAYDTPKGRYKTTWSQVRFGQLRIRIGRIYE